MHPAVIGQRSLSGSLAVAATVWATTALILRPLGTAQRSKSLPGMVDGESESGLACEMLPGKMIPGLQVVKKTHKHGLLSGLVDSIPSLFSFVGCPDAFASDGVGIVAGGRRDF